MKCVIGTPGVLGIIMIAMILACGGSKGVAPDGGSELDEHWYNGVDNSAVWIDIDDRCAIRVEVTREKADSICQARGFDCAAGYDPLDCWVGGIKDTFFECVACTCNK